MTDDHQLTRLPGSAGVWYVDPDREETTFSLPQRLRLRAYRTLRSSERGRRWIADRFHEMYYASGTQTWKNTTWQSINVMKCPFDLWMYHEILHRIRPDLVIETGTFNGGSALYFAQMLDLEGCGEVISIDLDSETTYPEHPRITYLTGSSIDPTIVDEVCRRAQSAETVMVILDSDHRAEHVAAELEAYHDLVTPGSYLVVEDTNVNGHPVLPAFGPGPDEATKAFIAEHSDFVVDTEFDKFFVSFNQSGWLRRLA